MTNPRNLSHLPSCLILSIVWALGSNEALAKPSFEAGIVVGGHRFADDSQLGITDGMPAPLGSAGLFGLRAALGFGRLAAEAELSTIPSSSEGQSAIIAATRVQARYDLLTGPLRVHAVSGIGALSIAGENRVVDSDLALHLGGGARYQVMKGLDVRMDLVTLIVPGLAANTAVANYEVSLAVTYRFGAGSSDVAHTQHPLPVDDEPTASPAMELEEELPAIPDYPSAYFETGSAELKVSELASIEGIIEELAREPTLLVQIEGHTSSEGSDAENVDLSMQRAEAVLDYLLFRGLAPERMRVSARGDDYPRFDNSTPEGRALNRRVELVVTTENL